ncbi:MAG: dioxygenase family protein [Candidatus Limnocylindrales bacterium]
MSTTPPIDRLRAAAPRVTEVLHDLARELDLTNDELLTIVGFLTEVGRADEFMLLSDVLGLSRVIDDLSHRGTAGTDSTVLGPFYRPGAPWLDNPGRLARDDEPGRRLRVSGQVTDVATGAALPSAVLDLWHSDNAGDYSNENAALDPFNLRGRQRADGQGRYEFETVVPVPYEVKKDGPVGQLLRALDRHAWRPAHLHYRVSAEGYRTLTTMAYFADDPYLDSDTINGVKDPLVLHLEPGDDEVARARFDVQLIRDRPAAPPT